MMEAEFAEKLAQLGVPDPQANSAAVVAELVGALSLSRAEPDHQRSDQRLAEARSTLKARLGLAVAISSVEARGEHNPPAEW